MANDTFDVSKMNDIKTRTCVVCGSEYINVCTVCQMRQRKADDMRHAKKQKINKFLKSYKMKYSLDEMAQKKINSFNNEFNNEFNKLIHEKKNIKKMYASGSLGGKPTKHIRAVSDSLEEKPSLKVFRIKVLERHHPTDVIVDIVLILSKDLETAYTQCGYTDKYYVLRGSEVEGPFKSGFILSRAKR